MRFPPGDPICWRRALNGIVVLATSLLICAGSSGAFETLSDSMAGNVSTNSTVGEILVLYEAGQSNFNHLDLTSARKSWEEGLAKGEVRLAADDPLIGLLLARLQLCYYADDRAKAFACFKRALAIAEKHFDSDDPTVALLLTEVGWGCNLEGQRDKALGFFQRALAPTEKAFGREHPAVERCLSGQ